MQYSSVYASRNLVGLPYRRISRHDCDCWNRTCSNDFKLRDHRSDDHEWDFRECVEPRKYPWGEYIGVQRSFVLAHGVNLVIFNLRIEQKSGRSIFTYTFELSFRDTWFQKWFYLAEWRWFRYYIYIFF